MTFVTPFVGILFAIALLVGSMVSGRQTKRAKPCKALVSTCVSTFNDGGSKAVSDMMEEKVKKEIREAIQLRRRDPSSHPEHEGTA